MGDRKTRFGAHLITCDQQHQTEFAQMCQLGDERRGNQYQNGKIAKVRWKSPAHGRRKVLVIQRAVKLVGMCGVQVHYVSDFWGEIVDRAVRGGAGTRIHVEQIRCTDDANANDGGEATQNADIVEASAHLRHVAREQLRCSHTIN